MIQDPYLLRYITDYLKLCSNCNRYDIHNYKYKYTCCMCKSYHCLPCAQKIQIRPYYHDEALHFYCKTCSNKYFPH